MIPSTSATTRKDKTATHHVANSSDDDSILGGILQEGAVEESVEAGELAADGDEEMDDTDAAADE